MRKDLEDRNRTIYELFCTGKSMQEIAERFGVSRQRIAQIISQFQQNLPDDDMRTLHRARLESYINAANIHIHGRPPYKTSPTGTVVYDNEGYPVVDITALGSLIDVARKLTESARKLDALDLPKRKTVDEDEAMRRVREYLASLPRAEVEDHNV